MPAVEAIHAIKSYSDKVAVDNLSFCVEPGEIFGLIGPNGAGKTTTIRMMMDIIKPDSGELKILGRKLGEDIKNEIGYLPEEKGLYRKARVMEAIVYLASLKGMDRHAAEQRAALLLDRAGLLSHKNKRIEELSKGMGQIIQFIVTVVHGPALIVLDEPFSGLDPVNAEVLKNMFVGLKAQGKTIILSSHRMNDVEELCDRVLMIDRGRAVLYGNLAEIKSRYRRNSVLVDFEGECGEFAGATQKRCQNGHVELLLDGTRTPQQLLESMVSKGMVINRFEVATSTLNEIFLKVAGGNHE
jgi:ABC-2 type transport system ATP-binding protein